MRQLMVLLGYINGKIGVKCTNCLRLKDGKCFGKEIVVKQQQEQRTCGMWKKRYKWIKRYSSSKDDHIKLKNYDND